MDARGPCGRPRGVARGLVPAVSCCARARCRTSAYGPTIPAPRLHVARGWRQRPCPKCTSLPGEPCRTPSGHEAAAAHAARLSPGGFELPSWELVWAELERCGASIALVPFHGRARAGGRVGKITLSRPIATPTSPDSRRSTARSSGPPRPSRRNHRSAGVRAIRRGRVLICQRPVSWREAGWRRNRNTEPSASAAAANPADRGEHGPRTGQARRSAR